MLRYELLSEIDLSASSMYHGTVGDWSEQTYRVYNAQK